MSCSPLKKNKAKHALLILNEKESKFRLLKMINDYVTMLISTRDNIITTVNIKVLTTFGTTLVCAL